MNVLNAYSRCLHDMNLIRSTPLLLSHKHTHMKNTLLPLFHINISHCTLSIHTIIHHIAHSYFFNHITQIHSCTITQLTPSTLKHKFEVSNDCFLPLNLAVTGKPGDSSRSLNKLRFGRSWEF